MDAIVVFMPNRSQPVFVQQSNAPNHPCPNPVSTEKQCAPDHAFHSQSNQGSNIFNPPKTVNQDGGFL
jgi:hypothetical protein